MYARAWQLPTVTRIGEIEMRSGQYVLHRAEGDVQLNEAAAMLLSLCDGRRDMQQIATAFMTQHPHVGSDHTVRFLEIAAERGWIRA